MPEARSAEALGRVPSEAELGRSSPSGTHIVATSCQLVSSSAGLTSWQLVATIDPAS